MILHLHKISYDELQGESNSKSNQKAMLEDYTEKNDFTGIRHFTDNDISGTSFEREELQIMLAEVEKGNIGTIIVKDMSRLGRKRNGGRKKFNVKFIVKTGDFLYN